MTIFRIPLGENVQIRILPDNGKSSDIHWMHLPHSVDVDMDRITEATLWAEEEWGFRPFSIPNGTVMKVLFNDERRAFEFKMRWG